MPHRRPLWLTLLPLVALAACAGPFPQTTLVPATAYTGEINGLFRTIVGFAIGVFVVVEVLLLYTLIRFRARPGAPAPKPTHGHTVLEIAWTLAPALILVFIAVPTMETIFRTQAPAPDGALKIEVIGHQWWWEYRYPTYGVVTANELHLPAGQPVDLALTSADVIHSFWAPAVFAKRDVIPGHTNHIVFTAESLGTFLGQCAEFCGASHANMRLRVMVDSAPAFDAWIKAQQQPAAAVKKGSLEEQGAAAFRKYGCVGCHTMAGVSSGIIGPNLTHVGSRTSIAGGTLANTADALAHWIGDPQAMKPGALMPRMGVQPQDLTALVAYLQSMK